MTELAKQVLAAADGARGPLVEQLARSTRTPEQAATLADQLLAVEVAGRRAFLEWVAIVPGSATEPVLGRVSALLSDRKISSTVRTRAAARLLRTLPDQIEAVEPVADALVTGLSPSRAVERLRHLQHQVEKNRALDAIIDRREQRVKMDCPRCGAQLPRPGMVKHLWQAHGLLLEKDTARSPAGVAQTIKAEKAAGRDVNAVDRAVVLTDGDLGFLRSWVAETVAPAEDLAPIRTAAAEHGCGLCPGCLTELPARALDLPPPLSLAHGRLAGDGYVIEATGGGWAVTATVRTPGKKSAAKPDVRRVLTPRGVGAGRAALVLLVGALAAGFVPRFIFPPFLFVCVFAVAAVVVYGLVINYRRPPRPADDRAIDAAWKVLGRKLIEKPSGYRFLTRLCRTSIGRGRTGERAGVLSRIFERVGGEGLGALQLLAVARILQMDDERDSRLDRAAKVASFAAPAFKGDLLVEFAEYVVAGFLALDPPPKPAELERLRVHLLATAFDAGLRPRDVRDLWAVCPTLGTAMTVEPAHRLGLLHGLRSLQTGRRWGRVAPAETVFELARNAPDVAGRVLAHFPDVLLYHRPDEATENELGPVLVCGRGVVVGGAYVTDPDAEVRVSKAGRSEFELVYGRHRLKLTHRPTEEFLAAVRGWLRFRSEVLLPFIDDYLAPGPAAVSERVRGPFRQACPRCGTVTAVGVGKVGVVVSKPNR